MGFIQRRKPVAIVIGLYLAVFALMALLTWLAPRGA
jgi:hypothetical protein